MEQRLAEQEDDGEDDDYGMEEYGRDDNEIDAEEQARVLPSTQSPKLW